MLIFSILENKSLIHRSNNYTCYNQMGNLVIQIQITNPGSIHTCLLRNYLSHHGTTKHKSASSAKFFSPTSDCQHYRCFWCHFGDPYVGGAQTYYYRNPCGP